MNNTIVRLSKKVKTIEINKVFLLSSHDLEKCYS